MQYAIVGNQNSITVPSSEWIVSGDLATGTFPAQVTVDGVQDNLLGVSSSLLAPITAPITFTATYQTSYYVQYAIVGNQNSITVPSSEWIVSGDLATGTFPAQVTVDGVQDNLLGVSSSLLAPITAPITFTATYQTSYYVQYAIVGNQNSITVPSSEWIVSGDLATGTFPAQVTVDGVQDNLLGVSSSLLAPITAPITFTATYQTSYYVQYAIVGNQNSITVPSSEWIVSGDLATGTFPAQVTVDGVQDNLLGVSSSLLAPITAPITFTATYQTSYYVQYAIVGNQNSITVPSSEWIVSGDLATGKFPAQVTVDGVQDNLLGVSSSLLAPITAPITFTATYQTSYYVQYAIVGNQNSITVPSSEWIVSGDLATGTFPAQVTVDGVQDNLLGVSSSLLAPITAPITFTATYQTSYYVQYAIVGNQNSITVPSSEWIVSGDLATGTFPAQVTVDGVQDNLLGVSSSLLAPITAPITFTATYQTSYYVQYAIVGNQNSITVPSSEWIVSGDLATGTFPAQVTVDGVQDNLLGVSSSLLAPITAPITFTATYQTSYYVQYAIVGNQNSITVPSSEWIVSGDLATGTYPGQVTVDGVQDNLLGVSSGLSAPITAPITFTATYQTSYYVQYAIVGNQNSITVPSSEWIVSGDLATGTFPGRYC